MARLFISYKREEQDYAFAIRQWLMDHQGWSSDDIFVDLDHLRAGVAWAERLFTEAESAQAMLFLASDVSLHPDSFCYRELRRARGEVLAVTLGGVSPDDERLRRVLPYESLARQITALDQQPTEGFEFASPIDASRGVVGLNRHQVESIGAILRDFGIAPNSFNWVPREAGPYPGLAPLQEGDEAIFFGRDTEIRDTLRALAEMQERASCKVFLIQAPSGAGKSSFLRAGLWARLRNHAAFTPLGIVRASKGILTHPEWGLISQLNGARSNLLALAHNEIEDRVSNDLPALLADLADSDKSASGHRRTVLLGIDQAEEIAELGADEYREFEQLLRAILTGDPALDVRLVMTARDDSVDGMLAQLERLGIRQEHITTERLHRLSTLRYRDIIQGPATAAQRAGWPLTVEQDLEIALAEAAGADRSEFGDALPLLAIALQRMVRQCRRPDGEITLQPADAAGFLERAIADAVKEALDEAGTAGTVENLAQLVVPYLATWDPNAGEAGAARRLVATSESLFSGERIQLRPLANALVDHRLLTRTQDADKPFYEVAHEALLRVAPMGDILFGLREQYLLAHFLKMEASEWDKHGRKEDHLARAGDRLSAARALMVDERFGPELKAPETHINDYLHACEQKMRSDTQRDDAVTPVRLLDLQHLSIRSTRQKTKRKMVREALSAWKRARNLAHDRSERIAVVVSRAVVLATARYFDGDVPPSEFAARWDEKVRESGACDTATMDTLLKDYLRENSSSVEVDLCGPFPTERVSFPYILEQALVCLIEDAVALANGHNDHGRIEIRYEDADGELLLTSDTSVPREIMDLIGKTAEFADFADGVQLLNDRAERRELLGEDIRSSLRRAGAAPRSILCSEVDTLTERLVRLCEECGHEYGELQRASVDAIGEAVEVCSALKELLSKLESLPRTEVGIGIVQMNMIISSFFGSVRLSESEKGVTFGIKITPQDHFDQP